MKPRILPAITAAAVVYPEHGTGRSARLTTCAHCGGKPLIVRRCGHRRTCAVCSKCGCHHRVAKLGCKPNGVVSVIDSMTMSAPMPE